MFCPVMKRAPGPQRKRTAAAMSPGSPRRPISGLHTRVVLRLGLARRPRRRHHAGHHRVDRDLVRGELVRERAGEADEAGLGGDDVRAARRAGVGGEAADIDDRAGAARLEMRQAGLHAMERAVEDDADDLAPFRKRHVVERLLGAHARRC